MLGPQNTSGSGSQRGKRIEREEERNTIIRREVEAIYSALKVKSTMKSALLEELASERRAPNSETAKGKIRTLGLERPSCALCCQHPDTDDRPFERLEDKSLKKSPVIRLLTSESRVEIFSLLDCSVGQAVTC